MYRLLQRAIIPFLFIRELRQARSEWILALLCIAAGIGGISSVESFRYGMLQSMAGASRNLLAADVTIRSNWSFSPPTLAAIKQLTNQGTEVGTSVQFLAMGRSQSKDKTKSDGKGNKNLLVTLRGVEENYPFYGEVITASRKSLKQIWQDTPNAALVEESVLYRLGVNIGDTIWVGTHALKIVDIIRQEPDVPMQFMRLGPKVLTRLENVKATGLMQSTSRILRVQLLRFPAQFQADQRQQAIATLRQAVSEKGLARVRTPQQAQPFLRRFLNRISDFLSLCGLVALVLGGVGVSNAMRVFVERRIQTQAVLKCLGAKSHQLFNTHLLLVLLLGIVGSGLGILLGQGARWGLQALLGELFTLPTSIGFVWQGITKPAAMGIFTTLWCAAIPLWRIRSVSPTQLFRRDVVQWQAQQMPRHLLGNLRNLGEVAAIISLIMVLGIWQAGLTMVTAIFLGGILAGLVLFYAFSHAALGLIRRISQKLSIGWRHGLGRLTRPGNHTPVIVTSLGLGVLVSLGVLLVQNQLVGNVFQSDNSRVASLFFLDIQPQQRESFERIAAERKFKLLHMVPLIRARIDSINGIVPPQPAETAIDEDAEENSRQRAMRFTYAITYRGVLEKGEELLTGSMQPRSDVKLPQVSIEDWVHDTLGLNIDDTIAFNIQGRRIQAQVTSIREVNWQAQRVGFSFVFLPGTLEKIPHVFVAGLPTGSETDNAALQQQIIQTMPNISVIDARSVLNTIAQVVDRLSWAIRFMATFCVAVGLIILTGAVSLTVFQRRREVALWKVLGAQRDLLNRVLLVEYLTLGMMAGVTGVIFAETLCWALLKWVFDSQWSPYWAADLVAVFTIGLLTVIVGWLSNINIQQSKPLSILREE